MQYLTKKRKERFEKLVLKECLAEPMTEAEKAELEDLQQVRDSKLERELERTNPGWKQREEEKFQILQQAAQLLEGCGDSTYSLLRTSNHLIQAMQPHLALDR